MARDNFCRLHGNTDAPCPECYVALEEQLRRLATSIDKVTRERENYAQLVRLREAERDRLLALLRNVEWCGGYGTRPACPICHRDHQGPFKGHAEDCALDAALEGR